MSDAQLIDAMAELWVENGGDVDGIMYCHEALKKAIKNKLKEKDDRLL